MHCFRFVTESFLATGTTIQLQKRPRNHRLSTLWHISLPKKSPQIHNLIKYIIVTFAESSLFNAKAGTKTLASRLKCLNTSPRYKFVGSRALCSRFGRNVCFSIYRGKMFVGGPVAMALQDFWTFFNIHYFSEPPEGFWKL